MAVPGARRSTWIERWRDEWETAVSLRRRVPGGRLVHSGDSAGDTRLTSALCARRPAMGPWFVDSSRSCPQECAQTGDGRVSMASPAVTLTARGHPTTQRPPSPPVWHLTSTNDVPLRSGAPVRPSVPGRRPSAVRTSWGRAVGVQGTTGGRSVDSVHSRRDVHVSTTGGRRLPTLGQHPSWRTDLGERARSPESTPVMTKMKEIFRGVLEPQSGWGHAFRTLSCPVPGTCPGRERAPAGPAP
jgi:hypothetical protein